MNENHTSKLTDIDPRSIKVNFSEGVQGAFADLAAAMHFSETFSPEMLSIVRDISQGKSFSVDDVMGSLTMIADGVFEHVHKSGDKTAAKAWREISSELLESGFTLADKRKRER